MISPTLEFVFEAKGALLRPVEVGVTNRGTQRLVDIGEGGFEGPDIRGTVLPGGADWQVTRPDGVSEMQVHYVLKTDDGVLIPVRARGLRHGPAEVMQRLARGEDVNSEAYYFRVAPVFEAPAGRYEWLNRSLFLTTGARLPQAIQLRTFRVL